MPSFPYETNPSAPNAALLVRDGGHPHFSAVQTPIIRLDDDKSLVRHVQPVALHGLDLGLVVIRRDDLLHLGRSNLDGATLALAVI